MGELSCGEDCHGDCSGAARAMRAQPLLPALELGTERGKPRKYRYPIGAMREWKGLSTYFRFLINHVCFKR